MVGGLTITGTAVMKRWFANLLAVCADFPEVASQGVADALTLTSCQFIPARVDGTQLSEKGGFGRASYRVQC